MVGSIFLPQVIKHKMSITHQLSWSSLSHWAHKIMRALAKKHVDPRTRPQTLQQAFNMAEEASKENSGRQSHLKGSSSVHFSSSVNQIYSLNLNLMRYPVVGIITTTIKEDTEVTITIKAKRIGARTTKVLIRNKTTRRILRTRMYTSLWPKTSNSVALHVLMKIYLLVLAGWSRKRWTMLDNQESLISRLSMLWRKIISCAF